MAVLLHTDEADFRDYVFCTKRPAEFDDCSGWELASSIATSICRSIPEADLAALAFETADDFYEAIHMYDDNPWFRVNALAPSNDRDVYIKYVDGSIFFPSGEVGTDSASYVTAQDGVFVLESRALEEAAKQIDPASNYEQVSATMKQFAFVSVYAREDGVLVNFLKPEYRTACTIAVDRAIDQWNGRTTMHLVR
jgi:hypothetical protein